jgi:dTDP-4-dehydrorhamnose reductase
LNSSNILVFGAGGQLGSELAGRAGLKDLSFHFVGRADSYIDDPVAVQRAMQMSRPILVINAAAYTNVDQAESEREAAFRGNAEGPRVLAAACSERQIPLIHISTHYVFDGRKGAPYVESDEAAPINVYGESKRAGEIAIQEATDRYLILRTSWLFGAYRQNFLKTILRLSAERDLLHVVADQYGNPTATADVADAILTVVPKLVGGEPIFGTYHVAGSKAATWYDVAQEIVTVAAPYTGRCPQVVPITTEEYPSKARRPGSAELDSSKFASAAGFRVADWRQRVHETVTALATPIGRKPA